ncbi:hypothetical protein BY996DRAFT_6511331, partial [Phakopsora pachyrhizi]
IDTGSEQSNLILIQSQSNNGGTRLFQDSLRGPQLLRIVDTETIFLPARDYCFVNIITRAAENPSCTRGQEKSRMRRSWYNVWPTEKLERFNGRTGSSDEIKVATEEKDFISLEDQQDKHLMLESSGKNKRYMTDPRCSEDQLKVLDLVCDCYPEASPFSSTDGTVCQLEEGGRSLSSRAKDQREQELELGDLGMEEGLRGRDW